MNSTTANIAGRFAGQGPSFLVAVGVGASVVLSRLLLQSILGAEFPFILALPGIMLAALVGGFWPAIIVTLAGLAVGQFVLTSSGREPLGPVGDAIFIAFGSVLAAAGGMRKRGLRRAKAYAERLSQTQAQLAQVARLNAMGEMAASLTHELNQPLTALTNYLNAAQHLLAQEGIRDSRLIELVGKASDQALRAGRIVARARANVDRGEIETREESLSSLVREAVDIAMVTAPKAEVAVRYDFDGMADQVLVDRIQVQQVVLNLVRNATEAMAASPRRELHIGSRASEPGYVHAHVSDTGPGIPPRLAARLFEPFVSDKPQGMGVGLSISRNIIETHGGRMWAEGNSEGGATFHFSLKRAGAIETAP